MANCNVRVVLSTMLKHSAGAESKNGGSSAVWVRPLSKPLKEHRQKRNGGNYHNHFPEKKSQKHINDKAT